MRRATAAAATTGVALLTLLLLLRRIDAQVYGFFDYDYDFPFGARQWTPALTRRFSRQLNWTDCGTQARAVAAARCAAVMRGTEARHGF